MITEHQVKRQEYLKSPEYWTTDYQISLFRLIDDYRVSHNLSKKQLSITLGISVKELNKICKGDARINKRMLIEIPLKLGYAPLITFEKLG